MRVISPERHPPCWGGIMCRDCCGSSCDWSRIFGVVSAKRAYSSTRQLYLLSTEWPIYGTTRVHITGSTEHIEETCYNIWREEEDLNLTASRTYIHIYRLYECVSVGLWEKNKTFAYFYVISARWGLLCATYYMRRLQPHSHKKYGSWWQHVL